MHQQSLLAFSSTHSRTCACLCPLLKRGSLQERYFLQVSSCQTQSQGGRLPRLCHLGVLRAWFGLRKATHSRMSRLCNGTCPNPRCKLPHVIRAKHTTGDSIASGTSIPQRDKLVETEEFIPLTFDESSEDELSGLDVSEDEPMDSEHGDDHVATSP